MTRQELADCYIPMVCLIIILCCLVSLARM